MKKRVITVSREFGSGGRSIGKEIAQQLGYAYYDSELVTKIAQESGLAEEFVLKSGEYAFSKNSFLHNLSLYAGVGGGTMPLSDQLYIVQHNVIRDLAEKEDCVIVGRCSDYILREREDTLHTFFHASMDFRADRIVRIYGEREDKPLRRLQDKDSKRQTYYRHYTGRKWGVAQNYHIALDSSVLGMKQCAQIVVDFVNSGK